MSDKNRAPIPARQESCEQVFDNEAIVGDITTVNITDNVTHFSDVDHTVSDVSSTNNDVTPINNGTTPTNDSTAPTNYDVTPASNDAPQTSNDVNNDVTPTNASANDDIIDDDITANNITNEQEYLTRISELESSVKVLTTSNTELSHKLTKLNNRCQLYEGYMTSHDTLSQERDQYKVERDKLQKKFDELVIQSSVSSQQNDIVAPPPPPNGDTLQLINYTDIKVQ